METEIISNYPLSKKIKVSSVINALDKVIPIYLTGYLVSVCHSGLIKFYQNQNTIKTSTLTIAPQKWFEIYIFDNCENIIQLLPFV